MGFPGGADGKEFACIMGDLCLVPGLERSPGVGHGNPLQYSCLENPRGRGAWWARVHEVPESDMTEDLVFRQILRHLSIILNVIVCHSITFTTSELRPLFKVCKMASHFL